MTHGIVIDDKSRNAFEPPVQLPTFNNPALVRYTLKYELLPLLSLPKHIKFLLQLTGISLLSRKVDKSVIILSVLAPNILPLRNNVPPIIRYPGLYEASLAVTLTRLSVPVYALW